MKLLELIDKHVRIFKRFSLNSKKRKIILKVNKKKQEQMREEKKIRADVYSIQICIVYDLPCLVNYHLFRFWNLFFHKNDNVFFYTFIFEAKSKKRLHYSIIYITDSILLIVYLNSSQLNFDLLFKYINLSLNYKTISN